MIQSTRRTGDNPLALSPIKISFAISVTGFAFYLFYARFGSVDLSYVLNCLQQIGAPQWAGALFLTGVSFACLGRYDVIWHRNLGTQVAPKRAHRSGMAAIAIGQAVGFCAVTAGLARWRSLPELDMAPVAKVSAAVTLSFVACWSILALPALWHLFGKTSLVMPNPAVIVALIAAIGASAVRIAHRNGVAIGSAFALLWWTVGDVAAAAGALYILMPAGLEASFPTLLAAFIVALGAAIMSNAPAGVGVFDVVLVGLLAVSGTEPLLAAILGYRIVYYFIPFLIGCIAIARATDATPTRQLSVVPEAVLDGFLQYQAPAAWGLVRQTGHVFRGRNLHFLLAKLPFCIVALGDPMRTRPDVAGHQQLHAHAQQHGRLAVFYQASNRLAAKARKDGWYVLPVARRAFLLLSSWTTSGSSKQSLRRKLAQATKAGVVVKRVNPIDVAPQLTKIARAWSIAHGGQMGFSMGTYCPNYVSHQAVFMITERGQNIGFVTFHIGHRSWALDLIRYTKALPQGAMHAAVVAGIEAAMSEGAETLCLAAAPYDRGWQAKLCKSRAGLMQFKQGFRPEWQTLYACAPNFLTMWACAITVILAIQRPLSKAFNWCAYGRKSPT